MLKWLLQKHPFWEAFGLCFCSFFKYLSAHWLEMLLVSVVLYDIQYICSASRTHYFTVWLDSHIKVSGFSCLPPQSYCTGSHVALPNSEILTHFEAKDTLHRRKGFPLIFWNAYQLSKWLISQAMQKLDGVVALRSEWWQLMADCCDLSQLSAKNTIAGTN